MQVATDVQAIQNQLPKARVVYCSATGVSEVGNMAFMTRLVNFTFTLLCTPFHHYKVMHFDYKSTIVRHLHCLQWENCGSRIWC